MDPKPPKTTNLLRRGGQWSCFSPVILIVYRLLNIALVKILHLRNKDGMVHYYDIVKCAAEAGVKWSDLKAAISTTDDNEEPKVPVKQKYWSKIVRQGLQRCVRLVWNKKALSQADIETISEFWRGPLVSRIAPNERRVVKRKSKTSAAITEPVFFRQCTVKEAYIRFMNRYPNIKCKRTTFHKYKPLNVKKPRSKQDCCPICKEAKVYLPILQASHSSKLTQADLKAKKAYEDHLKVHAAQTRAYDSMLDLIQEGQAVMVMDFKANISLGKGPEEDSHVFFSAPQRTVFGAVVFFRKNDIIYKVNFTLISQVLVHDSRTLREMLRRHILCHGVFKHFGAKIINVWMDNAPQHFRNFETMATFADLSEEFGVKINVNFFAEYHGKSECDRHFGLISRIYTEKTRYGTCKDVHTTEDFLSMYKSAIMEFGGHVVPRLGANYTELEPESGSKLNVIAEEFTYEGLNEFVSKLTPKEKKKPVEFPVPYTRRKLVVGDQILVAKGAVGLKFSLYLFYRFEFSKTNTGNTRLAAKLCSPYSGISSPIMQFATSFKESDRDTYSVQLGVSTSFKPKYSSLVRGIRRGDFHEDF